MELLGQRVMLTGLAARADLNGQFGMCVSHDAHAGRYTVTIEGGGQVALKSANIKLVSPPPKPGGYVSGSI